MLSEANYFSSTTGTIANPIDLFDYLTKDSLSDFSYKFENINVSALSLYLESPNVTFSVTNQKEYLLGAGLENYFGNYTPSVRRKYLVKVHDDNDKIIYTGMIYADGIKFNDRKKEIMDITVVGLEKEFKEYYSNTTLKDINYSYSFPFSLTNFKGASIQQALNANFTSPNLLIAIAGDLIDYIVAKYPYTYAPISEFKNNFVHIKTGYQQFSEDGCTIYDWLNSICLSMGWQWFFYLNQLVIKNRNALNYSTHTINYDETFITHDVDAVILDTLVDSVMIDDGMYWSKKIVIVPNGTDKAGILSSPGFPSPYPPNPYTGLAHWYLGGDRRRVYSENRYSNLKTIPFNNLRYYLTSGQQGIKHNYQLLFNNRTAVFQKEDDNGYYFYDFNNVYDPEVSTRSQFSFPQQTTLRLNPRIVSDEKIAGIDIENVRSNEGFINIGNGNFWNTDQSENDNAFTYTGHAGNSLFKLNETSGKYETYEDYIETDLFKNNFKKMFRSNLQILLTLRIKELITNPLQTFRTINYPYYLPINNVVCSLQAMKFNYLNEETELTLQIN